MTSPNLVTLMPGVESLTLKWANGETTTHDLRLMLGKRWAADLNNPALFAQARISADAREVTWPGSDITLSADGLWEDIHPRPNAPSWMSAAEFQQWRDQMAMTWDDAAKALNIARRTVGYYLKGEQPIPKAVWLACIQLAQQKRTREELNALTARSKPRVTWVLMNSIVETMTIIPTYEGWVIDTEGSGRQYQGLGTFADGHVTKLFKNTSRGAAPAAFVIDTIMQRADC